MFADPLTLQLVFSTVLSGYNNNDDLMFCFLPLVNSPPHTSLGLPLRSWHPIYPSFFIRVFLGLGGLQGPQTDARMKKREKKEKSGQEDRV